MSEQVVFFASGSNQSGEIRALRHVDGANVGVVAARVAAKSPATKRAWNELLLSPNAVFIDSGAFEEVSFPEGVPTVVKPLDDPKYWDMVFDVYAKAADAFVERAYLVAPDKVAFQADSLARLTKYADRVLDLWERGANILVPLQKGELSLAEYHAQAQALLDGASFIPCLPMKKDATSHEEVLEYVAAVKPAALHLLGLGGDTKPAAKLIAGILELAPNCQVSCDSCLAKRWSGNTNGPQLPDGSPGPRKYTAWSKLHIEKLEATAAAYPDLQEVIAANEVHLRKCLAFWLCAQDFWTSNGLHTNPWGEFSFSAELPADCASLEAPYLPLARRIFS